VHLPPWLYLGLTAFLILAISAIVHQRVTNDSRAQDTLNFIETDHRGQVAPNVSVDER
jgi:hypothetical protein